MTASGVPEFIIWTSYRSNAHPEHFRFAKTHEEVKNSLRAYFAYHGPDAEAKVFVAGNLIEVTHAYVMPRESECTD